MILSIQHRKSDFVSWGLHVALKQIKWYMLIFTLTLNHIPLKDRLYFFYLTSIPYYISSLFYFLSAISFVITTKIKADKYTKCDYCLFSNNYLCLSNLIKWTELRLRLKLKFKLKLK